MKYIVTINNNNYEVEVEQGEARIVKTNETAAAPVAAQQVSAAAPAVPVMAPQNSALVVPPLAEGDEVASPMPGVILQIRKNSGDHVKEGETLFILEAMKMENEIVAPKDGVIVQINTANGATVNTGDILAVMQ